MSNLQHSRMREGMARLAAKLRDEAERELVVAFLGGSITEGFGASDPDETSWRALTEKYFTERYPSLRWRFINAGVGGTDSSLGAHRIGRHVFEDGGIDLLFVEFAVNDGQKRAPTPEGWAETIRGMEGIVRRCRKVAPDADIVFLYSADEQSLAAAEPEPFFIAVHEKVAEHYGLPSISFLAGVRERIRGGDSWRAFAPDGVHPNDEGHVIYAGMLREFLELALSSSEGSINEPTRDETSTLPEPLRSDNYERAGLIGAFGVRRASGMSWLSRPNNTVNWRYPAGHLYGEGDTVSFTFDVYGRSAGLLLLCGPDTGAFAYSINGGEFLQYDPYDEWCPLFYRPVKVPLVSLPAAGQIEISVHGVSSSNGSDRGAALRVLGLLYST
ncbi:SGNH/GDSL hydrolase family protein [Paenibacillus sp. NPDC058071]|uniref:SGNH/GDSL hydrolase family protein n=1 Tax=Paenibacillus sp. NPDC058071 TaxID=3346326 RepID=UPI0036DAB10D